MNLLALSFGFACGFGPNISLLTEERTSPLPTGKITKDESSWIVSLLCIGGAIGNFFFSYITNRFGRKKPIIAMAIPNIVSEPKINSLFLHVN